MCRSPDVEHSVPRRNTGCWPRRFKYAPHANRSSSRRVSGLQTTSAPTRCSTRPSFYIERPRALAIDTRQTDRLLRVHLAAISLGGTTTQLVNFALLDTIRGDWAPHLAPFEESAAGASGETRIRKADRRARGPSRHSGDSSDQDHSRMMPLPIQTCMALPSAMGTRMVRRRH